MRLRQRLQRLEAVFTRDDDAEVVSVDCYWDDGREYIGTMKVARCHVIKTHNKTIIVPINGIVKSRTL